MKRITFVCSGNTCRSPMAEGIFNKIAKEKNLGWVADSCGLTAYQRDGATEQAITTGQAHQIDLSEHYSRMVSRDIMENADLVAAVTMLHKERLVHIYPEYIDKIVALNPSVPDPYGETEDAYASAFALLTEGITALVEGLK